MMGVYFVNQKNHVLFHVLIHMFFVRFFFNILILYSFSCSFVLHIRQTGGTLLYLSLFIYKVRLVWDWYLFNKLWTITSCRCNIPSMPHCFMLTVKQRRPINAWIVQYYILLLWIEICVNKTRKLKKFFCQVQVPLQPVM